MNPFWKGTLIQPRMSSIVGKHDVSLPCLARRSHLVEQGRLSVGSLYGDRIPASELDASSGLHMVGDLSWVAPGTAIKMGLLDGDIDLSFSAASTPVKEDSLGTFHQIGSVVVSKRWGDDAFLKALCLG